MDYSLILNVTLAFFVIFVAFVFFLCVAKCMVQLYDNGYGDTGRNGTAIFTTLTSCITARQRRRDNEELIRIHLEALAEIRGHRDRRMQATVTAV
uniref:Col_cuticle_N domain-containing protein n=1 Tax=Caenorhabditis tropicalis TaxID=1561998 RepID=A0A1I7TBQ3_9PELO